MKPLRNFLLREFRINISTMFVAATFRFRCYRRLRPATTVHRLQLFFGIALVVTTFLFGETSVMGLREAVGQTKLGTGLSYGRDPFLLPSGVRVPLKAGSNHVGQQREAKTGVMPVEATPPPLIVKAILIGESIRLASIDRHIVTVGDRIHDEKVLEIQSDRITLEKGNQKRTLFLSQSPIRLSVEER